MAWSLPSGGGFFDFGGNPLSSLGVGIGKGWNWLLGGAPQTGEMTDDFIRQQLMPAALGTVPSAAESMMGRGMDQGVAQQYAIARSLPGLAPAAGARQASVGAANVAQNITAQTGILRAQEQERARQLLLNALLQQRQANLQDSPAGLGLGILGALGGMKSTTGGAAGA